ncbi:MAG: SPOR domain-containing protein [Bacteroidetes bacterium]|nr:SPOR domain-containing protein [Bacteroidota bacterium]
MIDKRIQVQLGISQSRDQLSAERDKFNKSFPDIRTYLNYEQPNFKLRAGDFKSKAEASTFMYSIRKQYPGCFLVEDIVEIKIQKSNEE